MPRIISCPQCGKSLSVKDELIGSKGRCPTCGHTFVIAEPGYQGRPPVPPPPAPAPWSAPGYAPHKPDGFGEFGPRSDTEWPAPPPSGPATAPATFHNLYLGYVALVVLTILAYLGGMGFFIYRVIDMANTRQQEVNRYYSSSGPSSSRRTPPSSDPFSEKQMQEMMLAILPMCGGVGLLSIASTIVFCILLYKCWDLIQDGRPQTTPGKAVGFLFIPFFQFYWMFVAIRGLAEDLNRYARWRSYSVSEANVGLVTTSLILQLCGIGLEFCSVIPLIGVCFGLLCLGCGLVGLILWLIGLASIKNAAAGIAEAKLGMM